jgi:hypothetical protein
MAAERDVAANLIKLMVVLVGEEEEGAGVDDDVDALVDGVEFASLDVTLGDAIVLCAISLY